MLKKLGLRYPWHVNGCPTDCSASSNWTLPIRIQSRMRCRFQVPIRPLGYSRQQRRHHELFPQARNGWRRSPVKNQSSQPFPTDRASVSHDAGQPSFQDRVAQQHRPQERHYTVRRSDMRQGHRPGAAYAQSKLACLVFAIELDRRLRKARNSIVSVAAHPGVSQTQLFENTPIYMKVALLLIGPLLTHGADKPLSPSLHAAPDEHVTGGDCYRPNRHHGNERPDTAVRPSRRALNEETGERLWDLSEDLTETTFRIGSKPSQQLSAALRLPVRHACVQRRSEARRTAPLEIALDNGSQSTSPALQSDLTNSALQYLNRRSRSACAEPVHVNRLIAPTKRVRTDQLAIVAGCFGKRLRGNESTTVSVWIDFPAKLFQARGDIHRVPITV